MLSSKNLSNELFQYCILKFMIYTDSINLAAFINKTPTVRFTLTRSSGSLIQIEFL